MGKRGTGPGFMVEKLPGGKEGGVGELDHWEVLSS